MSKLSLNEIRVVQSLSIKKKVPFSQVSDKEKKIYRQLSHKGVICQNGNCWELVAKNSETE
jgi:hypothetical protein